jgi:hypothetical protein
VKKWGILHVAVFNGAAHVTDLLLSHPEIDINLATGMPPYFTPLMAAIATPFCKPDIVQRLVSAGASLETVDAVCFRLNDVRFVFN